MTAFDSFKQLCLSKAQEAVEQLQSMSESAETKSVELLQDLQTSNSDNLAILESLFTVEIASSLTDAAGNLTDAGSALQSLGTQDIEKYRSNIDDILEYSDKLTDIYDEIKPVIDLLV